MALFTDEEIKEVESAFGIPYKDDPERLRVIQCAETKDIVACPGSGKTTCLAAKLYLLAKRLPFGNGAGICVLAHTNNTIDEIKNKLGRRVEIYNSYPNFLGTIQSFVDRFLAIPANIEYFGKRPEWIEHNKYENAVLNFYHSFPWKSKIKMREWAYANSVNKGIEPEEFILNIRYDLLNNELLEDFYKRKKVKLKKTNPKFKEILKFKLHLLEEGILHYDDAYFLAEKYLADYSITLRPIFSKRFNFVFIDEMQDTAKYQLNIIDKCFDDNVKIQKFGDPNQAIFSHTGTLKADRDWIEKLDSTLAITSSKRFREPIAQILNRLGLETYENPMHGEGQCEEAHCPVIIVFNADNRGKVLEVFAEIIKEKTLNKVDGEKMKPFKAVGWVAKERDDDKLVISSYYSDFIRQRIKQRKEFDCLDGYMRVCNYIDFKNEGLGIFKDVIFRCLAKVLQKDKRKFNNKFLTAAKLEEKLYQDCRPELTQLRKNIINWYKILSSQNSIRNEVGDYINGDFSKLFGDFDPNNIKSFLTEEYKGDLEHSENKSHENKVIYDDIEIEISTIHGAKGQTHEATLYLETFYKKNDIEDIITFLKKESVPSNDTQKSRLKMAYVGMSRPRSLLCVAACEESVEGHEEDLRKAGWEIRKI